MTDLQPEPVDDPYEGMSQAERDNARKKDIASDLRALVRHPGWQYLCTVLQQQAYAVKLRQLSAGSLDALLAVNCDLREAETYAYVINMPETVINEFETDVRKASDVD